MTPSPFPARRHALLGLAALATLVGTLGLWGGLTTLDGAVIAPGQVEVAQNRQVVQHPDGGVVASVAIREGQPVAAGDLLLTLDGTAITAEHRIVTSQLLDLRTRRARLEAERDDAPAPTFPADLDMTDPQVADLIEGQRRLFLARRDTLAQQTEQLARRSSQITAQIEGIDAQTAALTRQLALIRRELTAQQDLLEKGLAQSARVLSLEREEAGLQGRLGELAAARAQAEGRITEVDLEILRLAALRREEALAELRDIAPLEREATERAATLAERIARLEIRAPVSGLVLGLAVTTPRAVIRPADPILFLVPQDRPLVIAARIPPLHIDEVHPGQPVRLMLSAFPHADAPDLTGTLSVISADALADPNTGIPYYRAEITLPPDQLALLGDRALLPGMPVDAYLLTTPRTPLAYLFQPVATYFRQAFRES
ncbi:HlyD family type I secretion periplasmic adaptor subunit [Tabrizicola sp. TH137]|uniref:HlyD family type I secretion periplasmic adaptor subunit n=1 Tax=Tabrizicola sp. TH137 TaxID=2067452 RepID=UPI000C7C0DDA|nr:HlyD family type I secretion periplasmic adaptor subunit [Tabrizicola sp. TH137]PLL11933.1 HlyD family type I secretion periplasmic adaptor subunit [Tabrizicola sp. TH137]